MKNNKNTILWIIGIVVLLIVLLVGPQLELFTIGGASMTRSVPSTVQPEQQFNIVYVVSASGTWGASIIDDVTGGCKFPDGSSQLKTVMLSADGNSKTIKITAPSSGSCTFSGDYKFGIEAIKDFSDKTITITTENGNGNGINGEVCSTGDTKCIGNYYYECINENWVSQGQINGKCGYTENGNGENGEVPSFSLNRVLFKIGNFEVTILILLIGIAGLFVIKMLLSRK